MLDKRAETFLIAAKTLNYTKAAKELFITQPAVSQHIQFLEREYGVKLFTYANRDLVLTKAGEVLFRYIQELKAGDRIIEQRLKEIEGEEIKINFSATLTIGEFTLAPLMKDFFNSFDKHKINLEIHNTEYILNSLNQGKIEFALIEGLFNKKEYNTSLLKEEDFILVVNPGHRLASKLKVDIKDILSERIIIREQGSGSREILERGLYDKNYSLTDFNEVVQIGNVALMKRMVIDDIGISFMYRDAAKKEIEDGTLEQVEIQNFELVREFNFVTMDKPSIINQTDKYYQFFKENMEKKR